MGVNILVAHGGGPTAVINTSLQGVVEGARQSGKVDKIYAARFGAEGILKGDLIDLTDVPSSTIAKLAHTPASAIGSCRRKLHCNLCFLPDALGCKPLGLQTGLRFFPRQTYHAVYTKQLS